MREGKFLVGFQGKVDSVGENAASRFKRLEMKITKCPFFYSTSPGLYKKYALAFWPPRPLSHYFPFCSDGELCLWSLSSPITKHDDLSKVVPFWSQWSVIYIIIIPKWMDHCQLSNLRYVWILISFSWLIIYDVPMKFVHKLIHGGPVHTCYEPLIAGSTTVHGSIWIHAGQMVLSTWIN